MTKKTLSLQKIAEMTNSELVGDPQHQISAVADLDSADSQSISFLANPRYEKAMQKSHAGAIFVSQGTNTSSERNFLIAQDPDFAFQQLIEFFMEEQAISGFEGIHSSAVIHPSVQLGEGVSIAPLVVIDQNTSIGAGTRIESGTKIGAGVHIGENCHLLENTVVRPSCSLGNRVILQPGAVIGSCGFGYSTQPGVGHSKLQQVGNVVIEDDVEIGANTTIDRARFQKTIIGKGTKIDNLVQIGHGVVIGKHNFIVAQAAFSGSSATEDWVIVGGQVGVVGHVTLSSGVMVGAKSGVSKNITKAGKYQGTPTQTLRKHQETQVHLQRLGSYAKDIKDLNRRVKNLEASVPEK